MADRSPLLKGWGSRRVLLRELNKRDTCKDTAYVSVRMFRILITFVNRRGCTSTFIVLLLNVKFK